MNESLTDDVIDLKCRSIRDSLLFFGIPEMTHTPPPPLATTTTITDDPGNQQ